MRVRSASSRKLLEELEPFADGQSFTDALSPTVADGPSIAGQRDDLGIQVSELRGKFRNTQVAVLAILLLSGP
jgi:hypothetical protein